MSDVYLGVDAGNSKTVAVLASADGEVLGRGRAGTGDIYGDGGADGAVREVVASVRAALAAAGLAMADVRRSAFRLAGVDWPEDGVFWEDALRATFPDLGPHSVDNDGFCLLRLGTEDGVGVSAIAGTGGAIAARGRTGTAFSVSFWLRDALGASGLGMAAQRAVVRAALNIDPPTRLTGLLVEHYGVRDVEDLLHSFTRRVGARSSWATATASRVVLEAAADGDAVAEGLVWAQGAVMTDYIRAASRRAGLNYGQPVPVVLGGALMLSKHRIYRTMLEQSLQAGMPEAVVQVVSAPAVIGAVLDAMAEDGYRAPRATVDRLMEAAHPRAFLST